MATSQEDRGRLQHAAVPIRQLGCAEAAPGIERELRAVPGVTRVYVNPVTEMAYVEYDADQCDETTLRASLIRAGYDERPSAEPRLVETPSRTPWARIVRSVRTARDRLFNRTPEPRRSP